jgi:conjugative transfer pilus assembly protein TraH
VGGVAGEIGIKRGMVCDAVGTSKGLFSDWARAAQKCGNDGQESSTLAQADGALKAQLPGPKNYAWDMINGSSLAGADTQMKEFVMTLTGTIIVGTRASDNEELRIDYVGHGDLTILDALLYGDSSVRIKKCENTTDCLTLASGDQTIPALGNKALMPKIAEMIRSMSLKIKTDQPLTAEERNLLGVSSVPIYKILAVQAASGFIVNNSEINVLAEITAIDVLNSIVQRLMDQIAAGQSNNLNASDMKNLEQFNAQVSQVRARLVQHEISVSNKVNQTFDIINNAIRIESTLQSRMAPGMAASLNFSRALSAQGLRP